MLWTISLILLKVIYVNPSTYRAAVVDYPPSSRVGSSPMEILRENAFAYSMFTKLAAKQGADIIVFPEYGLTSLTVTNSSRQSIEPYLQNVLNFGNISWIPCLIPRPLLNVQILHILSCAARENSIVLVANLLTRHKCNRHEDPFCPFDGKYHFNSNVIFDKNGTLIAQYHKQHLFLEEKFLDRPPKPQDGVVDVGFTLLSTCICFDIDFYNTAVTSVRVNGIRNVVVSSAWSSELPFVLAPQLYAAWAAGLGVNFIGANLHQPTSACLGSGIYSSQLGAINEIFDLSSNERLILADLPINPLPLPRSTTSKRQKKEYQRSTPDTHHNSSSSPVYVVTNFPSSRLVPPQHKVYYQPLHNFTAMYLSAPQGLISVKHGRICCRLDYVLNFNFDFAVYALLAYDGIRSFSKYEWGIQECTVLRCEVKGNLESCGRIPSSQPSATFDYLNLSATLATDVILPSILKPNLRSLPRELWNFSYTSDKSAEIQFENLNQTVIAVNLYGIDKKEY